MPTVCALSGTFGLATATFMAFLMGLATNLVNDLRRNGCSEASSRVLGAGERFKHSNLKSSHPTPLQAAD